MTGGSSKTKTVCQLVEDRRSRNSPFDGKKFRGGPMATVVRGEFVWKR